MKAEVRTYVSCQCPRSRSCIYLLTIVTLDADRHDSVGTGTCQQSRGVADVDSGNSGSGEEVEQADLRQHWLRRLSLYVRQPTLAISLLARDVLRDKDTRDARAPTRRAQKPLTPFFFRLLGCHVMERESFENEEVAAILNDSFIPIKIDREERPDVDRIYMNYVQATTGSGGWPLNVFLTPDLEPIFGGTYWPGPESTTTATGVGAGAGVGAVGFSDVLRKIRDLWRDQPQRCVDSAKVITSQLRQFAQEGTIGRDGDADGSELELELELLDEAYEHFARKYDTRYAGFGVAPKFPTPVNLGFLLRLGLYPKPVVDIVGEKECEKAKTMAVSTLRAMSRGGIRDHVGHGFARYSVTRDWSLPHFEKMSAPKSAKPAHRNLSTTRLTGD